MQQSRDGELAGAGAAADRRLGLEHRHLHAIPSQLHGTGKPVGARADDDRVAQATGTGSSPTAAPVSTATGRS